MSYNIVQTPYQHDVQVNGVPMVPLSTNPKFGIVPIGNPDGTPLSLGDAIPVSFGTAFSNTIDNVGAYDTTDAIMNGLVAVTPITIPVSVSASGVTNLVPAITGKKIRVIAFNIKFASAVSVKLQSHTTPTDLNGYQPLANNDNFKGEYNPKGHMTSNLSEALDINLSGASQGGGWLTYIPI